MARSNGVARSRIQLKSLGDCAVLVGEKRIDPRAQVTFAALLRLVVEAGKSLSRSEIQSLLWPRARHTEAGHRLRQIIYELKSMGIDLMADERNVTLDAKEVVVDFRDAIANSHRDCNPLLSNFLPDYDPRISPAFETWLETTRQQVNLQIRNALLTSIGIQRSSGRWNEVEAAARRCLTIDPLNEEATLSLAEAMAMGGNKLEALRLLDRYAADLDIHAPKLGLPSALLRQRISDRLLPVSSPLIGREQEMAPISKMIREIRNGVGGGHLVVGEAGLGKTRIVQEARRMAAIDGVSVVATECLPSDTVYPLSIVTKLLLVVRSLPGALGCSPASLAQVGKLLDERFDSTPAETDSNKSTVLYRSLRAAIVELFAAVTHEIGLLVVVDDVDQADKWSIDVVADLVAASRSLPLVILLTSRSEYGSVSKLTNTTRGLRSSHLRSFSRDEALALLRSLTSAAPACLGSELQNLYVEMADGNPLSIHELAHYWISCGHISPIPPNIELALQHRASELDGHALSVLQAIVLLGHNATVERLSVLCDRPYGSILSQIESLEREGVIRWEFKMLRCSHARLAELISDQLSTTATIALHKRIADLLRSELELPGNCRLLWDCAYHYRSAGSYREGITLLARCSDRLLAIGLPHEARTIWDRALESSQTDEERVLAYERMIPVLRSLGDLARSTHAANDLARLRASLQLTNSAWSDWQIDVLEARMYALENVEPILAEACACLADESTVLSTRIKAGICAMICACNLHDYGRLTSVYHLLHSLTSDVDLGELDRLTIALIYNTELGDLEKGATAAAALVTLARRAATPGNLAQSLRRHAHVLRLLGRFEEARAALTEATQLAEWMGSRSYVLRARCLMASAMLGQGDLDAARELLYQTISRDDTRSFPYRAIELAQLKAMLALMKGDLAEARRLCKSRLFGNWRSRSVGASGRIMYYSLAISALISPQREISWRWRKQLLTLEREFLRLQGSGDQDFIAYALCKSLQAQGQNSRAESILTDYFMKHRREQYPVPLYLRDLLRLEREQQGSNSFGARAMSSPA